MILRACTLILCLVFAAGCHKRDVTISEKSPPPPSAPSAAPVKSRVDVCTLLTSDELKGVQGEAYKAAQRSDRLDGDFIVAQCYYAMPTTANSVVLNVTTAKSDTTPRTPKTFWEDTFGRNEKEEREGKEKEKSTQPDRKGKDKEEAAKTKQPREEGEGEGAEAAPPKKIEGLGEEAFWIASRVGGALYVLKKDLFFRLSVGGAGDESSKLSKSKTLAQSVLKKI